MGIVDIYPLNIWKALWDFRADYFSLFPGNNNSVQLAWQYRPVNLDTRTSNNRDGKYTLQPLCLTLQIISTIAIFLHTSLVVSDFDLQAYCSQRHASSMSLSNGATDALTPPPPRAVHTAAETNNEVNMIIFAKWTEYTGEIYCDAWFRLSVVLSPPWTLSI